MEFNAESSMTGIMNAAESASMVISSGPPGAVQEKLQETSERVSNTAKEAYKPAAEPRMFKITAAHWPAFRSRDMNKEGMPLAARTANDIRKHGPIINKTSFP